MALVSLEFRLADYVDVVADRVTVTVDRTAASKHVDRNYHSRRLQCGWVYRRGERCERLAVLPEIIGGSLDGHQKAHARYFREVGLDNVSKFGIGWIQLPRRGLLDCVARQSD